MDAEGYYSGTIFLFVGAYLFLAFYDLCKCSYTLIKFWPGKATTFVTKTFGDSNGQDTELNNFKTKMTPRSCCSGSPHKTSMEKDFQGAVKKTSRIKSPKINSSQFRDYNSSSIRAPSQNETKAADLSDSEVEDVYSGLFFYSAANRKKNTQSYISAPNHSELNDAETIKSPRGVCSGFPSKTRIKNDEPREECNIKEFKSVINGIDQNVCNVSEKGQRSDNKELSVENKRNITQRQTLNSAKIPKEKCYLHTLSQYRKFSSDVEIKHKRESAKEATENHELKTEESTKQTDELSGLMRERLVTDSGLLTKRKMLLKYGQEISDFILGVHFAIEDISSLYSEWSEKRENTMQLFITAARNLDSLKNVPGVRNEIMKLINVGGHVISVVPLRYCSLIGRLISAVASIVPVMTSPSNPNPVDIDKIGITLSLQRDLEVSSELYQTCLSCDRQIQNTRELIEKFYLAVTNKNFECLFETSHFLQEIMELKPERNTFYKRLRKSIEKTIQKDLKSELEISFCNIFDEYPCALNIVDKLDWRFRDEGFKFGSLENRYQELSIMLMNYNSLTLDDILFHIQSCIEIFGKEELAVKRTLSHFQTFKTCNRSYK